jgi:large subunit ribosomal protein L21
MQFAVIKTGGKQYKVAPGDVVKIEKMAGDWKKGDKVTFDEVMAIIDGDNIEIGSPMIKAKKVEGIFEMAGRNKTIDVIKYKAKSNYYKKRGHRQPYIKVKIDKIA